MKTLLTCLIALVFAGSSPAQSSSADDLYRQLTTDGKDSGAALQSVLTKPDIYPAAILLTASGVAFRENQIEDSGYLFYIALIRLQFDLALFPPTGTGDDSPTIAISALQKKLGSVINPVVMADSRILDRVIARVKAWNPDVPDSYSPGWKYSKKGNRAEAEASIQAGRAKLLADMRVICTLLQD